MKLDPSNQLPASSVSPLTAPGGSANDVTPSHDAASERQGFVERLRRRVRDLPVSPLSPLTPVSGLAMAQRGAATLPPLSPLTSASVPARVQRTTVTLPSLSTQGRLGNVQPLAPATRGERPGTPIPPRRLQGLTEDVMRIVGGFSRGQDVLALADAHPTIGAVVAPMLPGAHLAVAAEAARNGGNVQQLAAAHGITDAAAIRSLERSATLSRRAQSAGGMARAGGNVLAVAARFGIASHDGIVELENQQIDSTLPDSAGGQARNGGVFTADIAEQHGITTQTGLARLLSVAITAGALRAVEGGLSAQGVIARDGITDPRLIQQLTELEARLRADARVSSQEAGKRRPS
jgi:hypothetical protein